MDVRGLFEITKSPALIFRSLFNGDLKRIFQLFLLILLHFSQFEEAKKTTTTGATGTYYPCLLHFLPTLSNLIPFFLGF